MSSVGTLLVGTGPMAVAYADVLGGLGGPVAVVGRGKESAGTFSDKTGLPVAQGGVEAWLSGGPDLPDAAIVATSVATLEDASTALLEAGVRRLLVEKPAGLDIDAVDRVASVAAAKGADVYVAYNRRFYAAVARAREMIAADGGVQSFLFEFTEFGDRVGASPQPPEVKRNWFLANSTHVVDLAFFLGGWPEHIDARVAGGLDWHPAAAVFAGSGSTTDGALFTYAANWDAPGRWGVELMTRHHRLILRPLEELQVQERNSVAIETVPLNDELDGRFKPGLYRQVRAFLTGDGAELLVPIEHQRRTAIEVYRPILAGTIS